MASLPFLGPRFVLEQEAKMKVGKWKSLYEWSMCLGEVNEFLVPPRHPDVSMVRAPKASMGRRRSSCVVNIHPEGSFSFAWTLVPAN
jgi:hypothetical protein